MTLPAPLTPAERKRIWRWQHRMLLFYGIAIALLALAGALMLRFDELSWVRRAALALLLVLIVAATFVQFRERCPALRPAARVAGAPLLARAMFRLRAGVRRAKLILQS